jgi:hypothetical protein
MLLADIVQRIGGAKAARSERTFCEIAHQAYG